MMIDTLRVGLRDRKRLEEMARVASRYGLGLLLARLGLEKAAIGDGAGEEGALPLPRRTRLALEELGPTFIKLGQILATRGDLLPPDWVAELEQLHSSAPTLPFEALRPDLEEALGQSPEEAFASVDPVPLAAASMAQVHRATLADGTAVVLKVRRPGIRPRIEADLRLIVQLAALAERANAEVRRFAPTALARQLRAALLEELDFAHEGRNADRLRADFAAEPRVVVPAIHWEWTSETLLVMDHVEGVRPRSAADLAAAGIDPQAIARLGADMVLEMVLVNGRFHADPHPGNLLCLPGDRLALLDLGSVGTVSPRRREEFLRFVQALGTGDPGQLAEVLGAWSAGSGAEPTRIEAAAERLTARHGGPQARLILADLVRDILAVLREEQLTLPPDLLLIFRALVTMDGVLLAIAPEFELGEAMRRALLRMARHRLSPEQWQPVLQGVAWELASAGQDAPRLIRAALRKLEAPPPAPAAPDPAPLVRALHRLALAVLAGAALVAGTLLLR